MTVHSVTTADDPVSINGNTTWKGNPIAAGDTFEIAAGTYTSISANDLPGTEANPITLTNTGGQVITTVNNNNFFSDCEWVIIDGAGDWTAQETIDNEALMRTGSVVGITFGFQFRHRIMIWDRSLGFTVKHCHFFNYGATAIIAFSLTNFPTWEMNDLTILYNHVQQLDGIFYIGNWLGNDNEGLMRRIEMAYNIARECSGSYQLRGAVTKADGLIHHNWAFDCLNDPNGWGSIDIGANCSALVYNNYLDGNTGFNLNVSFQCRGDVEIYNNVILNSGTNFIGRENAIQQASNDGGEVRIYNNTIISAVGEGIHVYSGHSNTHVYNNIILDVGGVPWSEGGSPPANFHDNLTDDAAYSEDSTAYTIATMKFVNAGNDNYHLLANSPAIDAGTFTQAATTDFDDATRTATPDVGAFEFIGTTVNLDAIISSAIQPSPTYVLDAQIGSVSSQTITSVIGRFEDDADESGNDSAVRLDSFNIVLDSIREYAGWRFVGAASALFPNQGNTINSACLKLNTSFTSNDDPFFTLYGEDVDDAATFSDSASNISLRSLTSASVVIDETDLPQGLFTIEGVGPIIQEIVNRPGYTQNSAIALIGQTIDATSDYRSVSFDTDPAQAASLVINYQVSSGRSEAHMLDALRFKTQSGSVVFDANLLRAQSRTHILDAAVSGDIGKLLEITHEDNNFSEYDTTVVTGGALTTASEARLAGTDYGLSVATSGNNNIYGQKSFITSSSTYRYRIYFDPNGFTFGNSAAIPICNLLSASSDRSRIVFTTGSPYGIAPIAIDDAGFTRAGTNYNTLTNAPHYIEIEVNYATAQSTGDGALRMWVDGTLRSTQTDLDIFDISKPNNVRIGVPNGVTAGNSGTIFLDEFCLRNDGQEIGAANLGSAIAQIDARLSFTEVATFTLDANLDRTQSKSIVLDANLDKTQSINGVLDATILDTFSVTSVIDTVLAELTASASGELDAIILRMQNQTTVLEALVSETGTVQNELDAVILRTQTKTTRVDAFLSEVTKRNTFLDALRSKDANHRLFFMQLYISETGSAETALFASIRGPKAASFTLDANINEVAPSEGGFNAILLRAQSATNRLDASMQRLQAVTGPTIDANLKEASLSVTGPILDGVILKAQGIIHIADAILSVTRSKTFRLWTNCRLTVPPHLIKVDGLLFRAANNRTNAINGVLLEVRTRDFVLDALRDKTTLREFALDAYLAQTVDHVLDAKLTVLGAVSYVLLIGELENSVIYLSGGKD